MSVDPFDWYNLFVNEIAGSMTIFAILLIIAVLYVAARMRFPNIVTIGIMAVVLLALSPFISGLVALVILGVGVIFTFALNKIVEGRS